jgi:hypothetical protein
MVLHLTLSDEFLDRHLGKEAATSLRRTCRSAWVQVVSGAAMIAVEFFAGPDRLVTAPPGSLITDAVLSAAMGNNGGTGTVAIVELLNFPSGRGAAMEVSLPGNSSTSITFPGVQSILVTKDMFLNGGSLNDRA